MNFDLVDLSYVLQLEKPGTCSAPNLYLDKCFLSWQYIILSLGPNELMYLHTDCIVSKELFILVILISNCCLIFVGYLCVNIFVNIYITILSEYLNYNKLLLAIIRDSINDFQLILQLLNLASSQYSTASCLEVSRLHHGVWHISPVQGLSLHSVTKSLNKI